MLRRPITGILAASLLCGLVAVIYLAPVRWSGSNADDNGATAPERDFAGSTLPSLSGHSSPPAPPTPPVPTPVASSQDIASQRDAGPHCETVRESGPTWNSVIVRCSSETITRDGASTSSISVSSSSFSHTTTTTGGAR
jgi:hypothetical protein